MTPSGELTIGTAADRCERLRTVTDGCERLRRVADGCGRKRSIERTHPQPPDPQSETGTLATHSGKTMGVSSVSLYLMVILWKYRTHPSGVPAKAGQTCSKDKSTLYAKDDGAGVDLEQWPCPEIWP